jgi:hypothetical protein
VEEPLTADQHCTIGHVNGLWLAIRLAPHAHINMEPLLAHNPICRKCPFFATQQIGQEGSCGGTSDFRAYGTRGARECAVRAGVRSTHIAHVSQQNQTTTPQKTGVPAGTPGEWGWHGVGMGWAWCGHGVGLGLAWGWHGVGMGLAWGWHGVGMGPNGVSNRVRVSTFPHGACPSPNPPKKQAGGQRAHRSTTSQLDRRQKRFPESIMDNGLLRRGLLC